MESRKFGRLAQRVLLSLLLSYNWVCDRPFNYEHFKVANWPFYICIMYIVRSRRSCSVSPTPVRTPKRSIVKRLANCFVVMTPHREGGGVGAFALPC